MIFTKKKLILAQKLVLKLSGVQNVIFVIILAKLLRVEVSF